MRLVGPRRAGDRRGHERYAHPLQILQVSSGLLLRDGLAAGYVRLDGAVAAGTLHAKRKNESTGLTIRLTDPPQRGHEVVLYAEVELVSVDLFSHVVFITDDNSFLARIGITCE